LNSALATAETWHLKGCTPAEFYRLSTGIVMNQTCAIKISPILYLSDVENHKTQDHMPFSQGNYIVFFLLHLMTAIIYFSIM
jgi:hypothetical protein